VTLVLTNRSTRPCRLYGYGGLQLLDAAGGPLPTHQIRVPQPPPQLISLSAGASALSTLYWVSLPMDKPCVQAAALLVIPPDETRPIRTGALGPVCEQGRLQQTAYTAGATPADRPNHGPQGQAPSSADRAAYARWQKRGAANYTMRLTRTCFCPPQGPVAITVRGGKAVVGPDRPSEPKPVTVQDLFDIIFSGRADHFTVSYDDRYGFPRSLDIDYTRGLADDEVTYKIADYRPTPD
jgi:hypothetical protein